MKGIAWIDVHHRKYKMDQISDSYLSNILKFINRGGGYDQFVTVENVSNLYEEATRRGLKFKFNLKKLIRNRFH